MELNQQQQKPGVLPSLADLDKPPVNQQQSNLPSAPPPPPDPKLEGGDDQKDPPDTDEDTEGDGQNVDPNNPGEPAGEEGDVDPVEIFNQVSKLRGDEFQFKFPEGVDPATPEGIHSAMQQVVDHELDQFEKEIQQGDPRAYSYMLHRANGGSDEDFFRNKTEVLPEWEVLKDSVDLQQAFYKRSLTRKGILPDQADLIIKDAIDKNRLAGLVETEYKDTQSKEKAQMEQLLELDKQRQQREQQTINRMGVILRERILENKNLNITIPDTKRTEFLKFVSDTMVLDRETGKWYINQEVNDNNIGKLIESLYYLNVEGKLEDIIKKKADQTTVKKLKMRMQSEKVKPKTSEDPNNKQNNKTGVHPAVSEL
jgi:hypothetical protein